MINTRKTRRPRKSRAPVLILLAALALSGPVWADANSAATGGEQGIDLRPRFTEGRTARYSVWTLRSISNSASVGEHTRSFDQETTTEGEVSWTVKQVHPDGSASCVMLVHWMTWSGRLPDGSVVVNDSREPTGDNEEAHRLVVAMCDVPLTFEVSADGTVNDVSGIDAISNAVDQDQRVPDALDFMESATDLALVAAAPPATAAGDEWDAQFTWNHNFGPMHQRMKYSLDSVEQVEGIRVATVTGRASLELEVDPAKIPAAGPPLDIQLTEGDLRTQIMFDLSRHEAVGRNTVEERVVEMTGDLGGGRTFQTVIEERIHSQVLRIAEQ